MVSAEEVKLRPERKIEVYARSATPKFEQLLQIAQENIDARGVGTVKIVGVIREDSDNADELCVIISYPGEKLALMDVITPLHFGSCIAGFKLPKDLSMTLMRYEDRDRFPQAVIQLMQKFQMTDPASLGSFDILSEVSSPLKHQCDGGARLPYGMFMGLYKTQTHADLEVYLIIGSIEGVMTTALRERTRGSVNPAEVTITDQMVSDVMHKKRALQRLVERVAFAFINTLARYISSKGEQGVESSVMTSLAQNITTYPLGGGSFDPSATLIPVGVGLSPDMYSDVDHLDVGSLESRCIHLSTSTDRFIAVLDNPLTGLVIGEVGTKKSLGSLPVCHTSVNFRDNQHSGDFLSEKHVEFRRVSEPRSSGDAHSQIGHEGESVYYHDALIGNVLLDDQDQGILWNYVHNPEMCKDSLPFNVVGTFQPMMFSAPLEFK